MASATIAPARLRRGDGRAQKLALELAAVNDVLVDLPLVEGLAGLANVSVRTGQPIWFQ